MLSDIVREEGENSFCNDGHWKKSFKGVENVCYLSVGLSPTTHEMAMQKCKYAQGYHKIKSGSTTIYYSKCNYKKGVDKK